MDDSRSPFVYRWRYTTEMYGEMVRSARTGRGLTQAQLATVTGIEQSNISAIENGRRAPSAETLHRLLFACGFELVARAGPRQLALPPPDAHGEDATIVGGESPAPDLPIATRARMLVAALDASEAILRSR